MKLLISVVATAATATIAIVAVVSLTAAGQEYVLNKEFKFGTAIESNRTAIMENQKTLEKLQRGQDDILKYVRGAAPPSQLTPEQIEQIVKALQEAAAKEAAQGE